MRWPWTKAKAAGATAFGGGESSRLSRRLRGWKADRRNINALLSAGGDDLRARSRQMSRENPYAANIIDGFVGAAVGAGIKPSSLIADPAKKRAIQAAFLAWTDEADADGLTDFYGLQALAVRAMFEGGECFVRMLDRSSDAGLTVPLQLQLIEAEHLPLTHNETLANGNVIRQGIEFDAQRRRVNYHFLRDHPGERSARWTGLERLVIPASEILHLYRPLRPGQIRGVPGLTPSMIRLYLLDQYDDAELDRKRTAAMFAGFITKPAAEDADPVSGVPTPSDGDTAVAPLEPGLMQVLLEGEDVKFSEPTEVGGSYEAFQYRSLCAIGSGVGLPYHTASGDLSKANYGSQRGGQVEFRRRMDQFQHMSLVFQVCRPVWQRWYRAAVLVGAIPVSASELIRTPAVMNAKWIPPRWEWVDPKKDREAQAIAEDRGWQSRSDSIEAEGYDPEEVDIRIAADRAREAATPAWALAPSAAAPQTTSQPGAQTPLPDDATGFAA